MDLACNMLSCDFRHVRETVQPSSAVQCHVLPLPLPLPLLAASAAGTASVHGRNSAVRARSGDLHTEQSTLSG